MQPKSCIAKRCNMRMNLKVSFYLRSNYENK